MGSRRAWRHQIGLSVSVLLLGVSEWLPLGVTVSQVGNPHERCTIVS